MAYSFATLLHARGLVPIPVRAGSKQPALPGWTDLTLESWASGYFSKTHAGGVGVLCGPPSGVLVVDIDVKDEGLAYWTRLLAVHPEPETLRATTGGGGLHYYFAYDERAANLKTGAKCASDPKTGQKVGIDIRGAASYVKAFSETGSYKYADHKAEITPMPPWVYELFDAGSYKAGPCADSSASEPSTDSEAVELVNAADYCVVEREGPGPRPVLGDEVSIAGVPLVLDLDLLRLILQHVPCPEDRTVWGAYTSDIKSVVRKGDARQHLEEVQEIWDAWCQSGEGYDEAENARIWCALRTIPERAHITSLIGLAVGNGLRVAPPVPPVNPFYASDLEAYDLVQKAKDGTKYTTQQWREFIAAACAHVVGGVATWVLKQAGTRGRRTYARTNELKGLGHVWVEVEGREKKVRLSALVEELCPTYRGITYRLSPPGADPVDTGELLNLAPRFAVDERTPGDLDPDVVEAWDYHVREVIADGDAEAAEYLANWYAHLLQRPNVRPETAVIMTGPEGTGKTTVSDLLARLMGNGPAYTVVGADRVLGRFNAAVEGVRHLTIDEACIEGGAAAYHNFAARLRGLVTGEDVLVERKGVDSYSVENLMGITIISNDAAPIRPGTLGRRYLVTRVSDKHQGDRAHWDRLHAIMNRPHAMAHLCEHLMRRDLSGYDPRRLPQTRAGAAMNELAMSDSERVLIEILSGKDKATEVTLPATAVRDRLAALAAEGGKRVSVKSFTMAVTNLGLTRVQTRTPDGRRPYVYKCVPGEVERRLRRTLGEGFEL